MVQWRDSKHAWSRKGTHNYGINYQETISPVVKINSIQVLLSLAANNDWPLQQLDVKMHFFMAISKRKCKWKRHLVLKNTLTQIRCVDSRRLSMVWSKRHGLGLKGLASQLFNSAINKIRLITLFIKAKPGGKITALIVYVDDIILTSNNVEEMKLLKTTGQGIWN